MKHHKLADIFPLMEGAEFNALAEDIGKHGLREPIITLDGEILDGRNRWRACEKAGVEPKTKEYRGKDPLGFVISLNLKRRHLDESQRAMVAARLATMKQGARTDIASIDAKSQAEAAELLNVSRPSVQRARTVLDNGAPELVKAVEQGRLPVSAAAQATKLSAEQQKKVAEEAEAGRANVVRTTIKQGTREVREADLGTKILSMPNKAYGVLYVDPPWRFEPYNRDTGLDRAADNHYPTMSLDQIKAVEVPAAHDAVLFLWATVPMLPEALDVMATWGFKYVSSFVWTKDRIGTGHWTRNQHDLLLIGTKGSIPAPAPGKQYPSVFHGPVEQHSAKPFAFRKAIEDMFPTLPRIELFARGRFDGWDVWGYEAPPMEAAE